MLFMFFFIDNVDVCRHSGAKLTLYLVPILVQTRLKADYSPL